MKIKMIKSNSLKLLDKGQLPRVLAYRISKLTANSPSSYVSKLIYLTEKYTRVKDFYKKYPVEEEDATEFITNFLGKE